MLVLDEEVTWEAKNKAFKNDLHDLEEITVAICILLGSSKLSYRYTRTNSRYWC
jgi:hypothetical protein